MIDWKRVQTLKEEIGAEDFEEVVPLFIAEVTEVTDRLREGAEMACLAEDLHFLKGSALNLGFAEFSALCHAGEVRAAAGEPEAVDVGAVVACFDQSLTVFEQGIGQGLAA